MKNSIPYIFIACFAFFMFRGIFAPGFMSGFDNSLHIYDIHYLIKTLIPKYHWINGWSMQSMAGIPIFVDYFQMGFMLVAILNKVFSISLILSYKIMVVLSYAVLGAGFYKISSYRFGNRAGLLTTLCLMLQKDVYLDRILGGMWNNYLGIGLAFFFIYLLDKNVETLSFRKTALLGLFLSFIMLTHIFVGVFAFLVFLIYAVPYCSYGYSKNAFFRQCLLYGSISIFALAITSYHLRGLIISRDYFSSYPYKTLATGIIWSLKSFFGPIEKSASLLSGLMINIPVLIRALFSVFGFYMFLFKERNREIRRFLACVFTFTIISLILFSDILPNIFRYWQLLPFISALQTGRFLVYAHIGSYLFAAYGIMIFLRYFRKKQLTFILFLTPILISSFFHYGLFARPGSMTLEESGQMKNIFGIWSWIDKNIEPEEGRVVYQDTFRNIDDPILGRSDVFNLSGIFTRVPQIGVSRPASPFPQEKYMRNDRGRMFNRDISEIKASFIKDMMGYFNSGYIVSVEPRLENILKKSNFFLRETNFGHLNIFRLKDFKNNWIDFEKDAEYKIDTFEEQHLAFSIANNSKENEVFIKVAYHPLWRASLSGKPVEIERDQYSLMKISLPHAGNYKLDLRFNSFNAFWVLVSFFSFMLCIVTILRKGHE